VILRNVVTVVGLTVPELRDAGRHPGVVETGRLKCIRFSNCLMAMDEVLRRQFRRFSLLTLDKVGDLPVPRKL
jgi:hypothetical protein